MPERVLSQRTVARCKKYSEKKDDSFSRVLHTPTDRSHSFLPCTSVQCFHPSQPKVVADNQGIKASGVIPWVVGNSFAPNFEPWNFAWPQKSIDSGQRWTVLASVTVGS